MKTENTTKIVASNTFYQFIGKGITMSITILATILITRLYGREAYGQFSIMQSWPALVYIIADFGLNAIATRELSKDFSKAEKYFSNILLMRLFFSLAFIVILWVALSFFPYSTKLLLGIRLSLFLILTQALFTTTNIIFQTKMRYDLSTISQVSGYAVILVLILIFSAYRVEIKWLSFSYVLGGLVSFFVATRFLKNIGLSFSLSFDKKLAKELFWLSMPLGIMFVFSQLNFKDDELLLSFLKLPARYGLNNNESVAVYSLPYKVFEVALVVPTFFMNAVYPVMVRHMTESQEKLRKTFKKSIWALVAAAAAAAVLGYFFSPLAIRILGGNQFGQSVTVLRILLGGLIFYYLTQPLSWLIVSLEKQKYLPYIYLAAAIFNLTANFIFIPQYSFYGAAVITHLSEVIILVMLIFGARKAWKSYYA
jgi:O-antigen/teichoic acid export membrane protein